MNEIVIKENTAMAASAGVSDLFNRFISYLDVSAKTLDTYKKGLRQLFKYFSLNNITAPERQDILNFKEYLIKNEYKPSTIQGYLTITKIFFKWTNQEGLYKNIAENIKGVKISKEHKKDYLTSEQVKTILASFDESHTAIRDKAIFALMVTTGLRTIEISRANISDLRTLGNSSVLYVQGKGKLEKNDFVKVSAEVERLIRDYLKTRKIKSHDEALFTSDSNNSKQQRLSTRSISSIIKSRMVNAGYSSSRLTAHSLRHTAVTLSFLAGREITEVQQFARHANISTTMIYCHTLDKEKNACNEAISKAIF